MGHGHTSTSNGDDALEMMRCCGAWSYEHEQWRWCIAVAWSYEHEQRRWCVGDGALLWGMVIRARAIEMVRCCGLAARA